MNRKGFAVGLILLLIGTSIFPITAQNIEKSSQPTSRGNWLYVGGSGPGNYSTIQDAIANASDGDTVFVYNGLYYGPIYIDLKLNLIGEDKYNAIIIDSGLPSIGSILSIRDANGINISGFTIQKSYKTSTGLSIYSSQHVIMHDTIIQENPIGMYIAEISDSKFYSNIITSNNQIGIYIVNTPTNCTFYDNIISNNSIGVSTYTAGDCLFSNNTVSNNSIGFELYAHSAEYIIEYNNFRNNEEGIEVNFQYFFTSIIRCNNFIENTRSVRSFSKVKLQDVIDDRSLLVPHVTWDNNYWGAWKTSLPRPICSLAFLWIGGDKTFAPINKRIIPITNPLGVPGGRITVGVYPSIQFDLQPAKEPYDI